MVWLKLNEALEHSTEHPALATVSGRMFSSYRLRVVNSWPDLIERIRILESGLDEGLLEIIKYMIWGHLPGHEPGSYTGDGLYFWYADPMEMPEPDVAFQLVIGPKPDVFPYPRSEYETMVAAPEHKKVAPRNGEWVCVNARYVLDRWL